MNHLPADLFRRMSSWRTESIASLIQKVETEDPRKKYPENEFLYVDISGVDSAQGEIKEWKVLLGRDAPSRARQKIRQDDVLVSTVRPNLNATALVPEFLDNQICSTGFCVLRSNGSVLPKYLYFFTRTSHFVNLLSSMTRGASYPAVTDRDVEALEIPVPPIETQKKIVAILESAQVLKQKREQANQMANKILQAVFLQMFGNPASNPLQWPIKRLGEVVNYHQQGYYTKTKYGNEGVSLLRISDIGDDGAIHYDTIPRLKASEHEINRFKLERGDLVLARSGTIGRCAVFEREDFPCLFAAYLIRFRFNRDVIPEFVQHFLMSSFGLRQLKSKAHKVAQIDINAEAIKSIEIPIPPIQRQIKFTEFVKSVKAIKKTQSTSAKETHELFQALMRKAFNGELVRDVPETYRIQQTSFQSPTLTDYIGP